MAAIRRVELTLKLELLFVICEENKNHLTEIVIEELLRNVMGIFK